MVSFKKSILATIALSISVSDALIPIEIIGKRFIKPAINAKEDGEVFFINGIDYQPGGSSSYEDTNPTDVLSDGNTCLRDAYAIQNLGSSENPINVIRVYTVNPELNHDECMSIFNAIGIYVIIDVNSPLSNESINRDDPSSSYNWWYLERVFKMIDAFKGYPNLLGFFSGNEVINDSDSADDDPKYIRAVQRDMKQYIANQADRTIPVGYSAADVTELRKATWEYLQCNIDGEEDESKSDFFGLNSYEWCSGISDWESSNYETLLTTFKNTTIPVFFSEYGCNTKQPRTFDEVSEGVFGGLQTVLSGGLIYEYSEESSNYGLVEIDDGDLTFKDDYNNLKSQIANITIPSISSSDVDEPEYSVCDSDAIEDMYSDFDADFDLPDQPGGVLDLILYGVNNSNIGKIIDLDVFISNYTISNSDGDEIADASISVIASNTINQQSGTSTSTSGTGTGSSTKTKTSSSSYSASATSTTSSSSSKAMGSHHNVETVGIMFFLASETILAAFTISAIYFTFYVGVIPLPSIISDEILPVLPWWGLVSFGCYALGTLGYGVYTFKDKEDKYKELLGEIDEAKVFLKANGVDVE
ncbi:glycoside hydrolase family 72 protein [[Candida] arabinofermentans NRRL YB-2248]|uniref:1,3-beta-glucanosyltransferase n=1 Tax=[Candida] arabinofermentans NRRL YB-2248 TaxID=983967 RepID=A0A1E4T754_9ASCO|nr:glycoside hydrolase family 72 protein [[Candida] arabinofermentans NRRL YB-2248]